MNLTSANEHDAEIERIIWVVKERSRDTRHSLPSNRIPTLMTIHVILNIGKMLNYSPNKAGVSNTTIPRENLKGENLDDENHLRLQYVQYCQVHENETPQNIKKSRR